MRKLTRLSSLETQDFFSADIIIITVERGATPKTSSNIAKARQSEKKLRLTHTQLL